jgi:glycosyltransferase involved in cell wall biosynthesis
MPRYLNLADVVVVPSDVETQPLAYLETQACARLLIASDILAAREFVVDGETGLLFRKGDVDDLAAKTVQAVRNPELRCRIGRKAAASVRAYDLDIMTMRYEDLLQTVARRRRPFPLRPGVR